MLLFFRQCIRKRFDCILCTHPVYVCMHVRRMYMYVSCVLSMGLCDMCCVVFSVEGGAPGGGDVWQNAVQMNLRDHLIKRM